MKELIFYNTEKKTSSFLFSSGCLSPGGVGVHSQTADTQTELTVRVSAVPS